MYVLNEILRIKYKIRIIPIWKESVFYHLVGKPLKVILILNFEWGSGTLYRGYLKQWSVLFNALNKYKQNTVFRQLDV